ncbi:MAG: ribonuclease Z [Propionibacteriaceae bacterium]|nr:ribonuclease Z [Propionibacteriaceae bacterium]
MKLTFLGTGAGVPSATRNVASTALDLMAENGSIWLFDAGEGTQHQCMKASLRIRRVNRIFITHLHGDHVFGLPGFLSSRSFQAETSPVYVYGPPGLTELIDTTLRLTQSHLTYPLVTHEVEDGETLFHEDHFSVSVRGLDHVVPCFGYRIEEDPRPGALQVDRLRQMGLGPGPWYGELKAGKTVTFPDGRTVDGREFLGPPIPGRVLAICGDTRPAQATVDLADNADVLVHESTYDHTQADLGSKYGHSTCDQVAQIARRAGVRTLLLTHVSARHSLTDLHAMAHRARRIHPDTRVMDDLAEVEVPCPPL